jgi:hypothetical protein
MKRRRIKIKFRFVLYSFDMFPLPPRGTFQYKPQGRLIANVRIAPGAWS